MIVQFPNDDEGESAGQSSRGDNAPRNILRVAEVLAACAAFPEGSTVNDVSSRIAMPRTSLYRIMRVLQDARYLERENGRYRIGPKGRHLGQLIVRSNPGLDFPQCARPVMEWLAEQTGESVTLGTLMPDRATMVFIDSIASNAMLRYTVPQGDRRPIYRSASGKVVLAYLPKDVQRDYVATTEFSATTPFTTRREDMPGVLDAAALDGYAYDRNGNIEGASALASPIFNLAGEAFASISIAGPTERMDADFPRMRDLVRDAARQISQLLGFEPEAHPPG